MGALLVAVDTGRSQGRRSRRSRGRRRGVRQRCDELCLSFDLAASPFPASASATLLLFRSDLLWSLEHRRRELGEEGFQLDEEFRCVRPTGMERRATARDDMLDEQDMGRKREIHLTQELKTHSLTQSRTHLQRF